MRRIIWLSLFFWFSMKALAQSPCDPSSLRSEEWSTRARAYQEIKECLPQERVKEAIIGLLELENSEMFPPDEVILRPDFKPGSEERSEYYLDLIQTVVSFHSEHGARALAKGAGRGTIVSNELKTWPRSVIPILVDQMLSSASSELRIGSIQDLKTLLGVRSVLNGLSQRERVLLRDGLKKLSEDENWILRRNAVEGIVSFAEPSLLPTLQELAQRDPDSRVRDSAHEAAYKLKRALRK